MPLADVERIGAFLGDVATRVAEFGWAVQGVFSPDDPADAFSYTVGLHAKGLPELWVGTLAPTGQGAQILNDLAFAGVEGMPLEPGRVGQTRADWSVPMRLVGPVDVEAADVRVASVFAREDANDEPLEVLQVLWPDEAGLFPDEDGYDHARFPQRVLPPTPRSYFVGLPVLVTVHSDGRVEYDVDTSEAGAAVREYEFDTEAEVVEQSVLEADAELVDADHERRRAQQ